MKVREILKHILVDQRLTQVAIAGRLGITKATMNNRIMRNNMSVETLNETLRAMDYKLVVMPANGKMPKDGYEVTE